MQIFLFYVQIAFTAWFVDSIHFLENSTSLCMEFYLREIRVLCQSLQNGRIDILFALRGTLEINFDAKFDYIPYCKCRKLYMKFFSAKTIENWFCMRRGYRLWLTSMLSNWGFWLFFFSIMVDRYLLHTFEACFHSTLRLKIRPNLSLVNKSLFWYNSLSNYIAFQSRCISSFASTQIVI